MKMFKKFIAGIGLVILILGVFCMIFYKIIYEPLHNVYMKFGVSGILVCLGVLFVMGILSWLIIKFITWASNTLV